MAIIIFCSGCKTRLTLGDDRAGDTVECPNCEEMLRIPPLLPPPPPLAKSPVRGVPVPAPDADSDSESAPPARRRRDDDDDDDDDHRPRRRRRPRVDAPEAFVWWAQRYKGNTFPFTCPDCRNVINLKHRVTQSNRKCPGCGFQITMEEIDKQLAELEPERQRIMNASSCGAAILLLLLPALALGAFTACAKWSTSGPPSAPPALSAPAEEPSHPHGK